MKTELRARSAEFRDGKMECVRRTHSLIEGETEREEEVKGMLTVSNQ